MLPVVLIHGLIGPFADPRTLAALHPATVVAPDLIGYGAAGDPGPITIDSQVEQVRLALDRVAQDGPAHVVGHSIGGVIAVAFAHRYRARTASLVSVEGNMTLADAFWTAKLAAMSPDEVAARLDADRADPGRWLADAGVEVTPDRLAAATEALAYQPAATLHEFARAVVDHTGQPRYQETLRAVFRDTPTHLVAGERSRAGWDLPDWALAASASYTEIPGTGHLVMLEQPERFGAVLAGLLRA